MAKGQSRNRERPDYEAALLVTDGESTKVAARVIFRGGDAYGIHPLEPRNAKVSFHKSGKRHVKLQGGEAQVEELMLPPERWTRKC